MKAHLHAVLQEYKTGLQAILGDSLDRVLLYGSQARGQAMKHSDIDVLCVMHGPFRYGDLIAKTSTLTSELSLKHDVVLSRAFAQADDLEHLRLPFYMNIRKEAVLV